MSKKDCVIKEDMFDDIFDSATISADELQRRKIQMARVLQETESAIDIAETQGKTEIAEKLRVRAELIQELLDRADELPVEEPEAPEDGAGGKTKSEEDGEDETPADKRSKSRAGENDSGKGTGPTGDEPPADPEDEPNDSEKDEKKPTKDDKSSKEDPSKGSPPPPTEPGGNPPPPPPPPIEPPTEPPTEPPIGDPPPPPPPGDPPIEEPPEGLPEEPPVEKPGKDPDEEREETEEEEEETEDDDPDEPLKIDPFRAPPPNKGKPPKTEREVETVLAAAKRILSKLDGDARRGAVHGVRDLLAKHGRRVEESVSVPLTEAVDKLVSQMSTDEFNDLMASTMDMVNSVKKVDWSDDLDVRAKKINADSMDATKRAEMEREDAEHVKADKKAARAHDRERAKYSSIAKLKGLDAFARSLYRAVKDQVEVSDEEVDSWAALDRRHEDDPTIVKKGTIRDDSELIPTVNVYFDQSGSWSNRDIEIGMRAISVINEFHERGEIKLQVFYMSAAGVTTTAAAARADGRAEGWHAALGHIKGSKAKNVVVLSDNDLDHFEWCNRPSGDNGVTRVDGCVWWLWKDGSVSKKALRELRGRGGSMQFEFEGA